MPLNVGGEDVTNIQVGATPVQSVHAGAVEVWRRLVPGIDGYTQLATATTVTSPTWARFVDIIALGAGSGGVRGNSGNTNAGEGGNAGAWKAVIWSVAPGVRITAAIGVGGDGGTSSSTSGKAGGSTTVAISDGPSVTAGGGAAVTKQDNSKTGHSPGAYSHTTPFDSVTVTGGGEVGMNTAGAWPGGGGGGGGGGVLGNASDGKPGASGIVWYRFRAY